MKPAPELQPPPAGFAHQYPEQTGKMKGYLRKHGVPEREVEDIVSEAWTRGLETYDPTRGLQPVQWVWYILQHNLLPEYGRNRKTEKETAAVADDPPGEAAESFGESLASEPERLVSFLRTRLPSDLLRLFNAMQEVTAETDSRHICERVAARLNVSMQQYRNMVKRLKRKCFQLRNNYNA